ncbi:MAG: hypothetical protein WEC79_04325, partial [Thermomicrobiales bacterium]
ERIMSVTSDTLGLTTPPKALVLQGNDPARALLLASSLRAAGWTANVDLRGRNLSATRRAALRQDYIALARYVNDQVEIARLSDDAKTTHSHVPSPEEVIGQ